MIDIKSIKAGMIVTAMIGGEHKMNKRSNPLVGRVTRNHTMVANVAGKGSYVNRLAKRGETPANTRPAWFTWIGDGIVQHNTTGERYVALLPSSVKTHKVFLVDGRPATAEEIETIKSFTPAKSAPADLIFVKLENLINAQ